MSQFDLFSIQSEDNPVKPEGYPEIVNVHWYGTVQDLPDDTLYMGRGSPYGNPFGGQGKDVTRDQACDRHAEFLRKKLECNSAFEAQMMTDMRGKKIACFCKNKHKEIRCHLDSYAEEYYKRYKNGYFDVS